MPKLAGFIRAGLQEGNHQEVTLEQEFRLAGEDGGSWGATLVRLYPQGRPPASD